MFRKTNIENFGKELMFIKNASKTTIFANPEKKMIADKNKTHF
jgi:hypothetical protein